MTQQLNAMQESIKISLDAADAATDVTSEYKRIKNEYLKTEQKMKEIHKYTTIIFFKFNRNCSYSHYSYWTSIFQIII